MLINFYDGKGILKDFFIFDISLFLMEVLNFSVGIV